MKYIKAYESYLGDLQDRYKNEMVKIHWGKEKSFNQQRKVTSNMKYLKRFENKELINNLKGLSNQLGRLKTLAKLDYRQKTPSDVYEDYFLEFKDSEEFKVDISRSGGYIGPIDIHMYKMLDLSTIESEFYRYVNKLESIKKRLEQKSFDCHFTIKLNGKDQSKYNEREYKNNIYEYQGLGDRKWGYDSKGNKYTEVGSSYRGTSDKDFPKDKVAIIIRFMII